MITADELDFLAADLEKSLAKSPQVTEEGLAVVLYMTNTIVANTIQIYRQAAERIRQLENPRGVN